MLGLRFDNDADLSLLGLQTGSMASCSLLVGSVGETLSWKCFIRLSTSSENFQLTFVLRTKGVMLMPVGVTRSAAVER